MQPSRDKRYEVAYVLNVGQRDYQEDALATDFPHGCGFGYAVLADGMGGHAAGDIASKIVVTEVFSELKFQSSDIADNTESLPEILRTAALSANECVRAHAEVNPETAGMGSTLVAPVLVGDQLYWISIGDSPLFLYRNGRLQQLNEDHSLAPQIDFMVKRGLLTEAAGRNHPDRNCLTSVLIGQEIVSIDCPTTPVRLLPGDIVIAASDGLQFLSDTQIEDVLQATETGSCEEIADALLDAIEDLQDEQQDNVSYCIIRMRPQVKAAKPSSTRPGVVEALPGTSTEFEPAWTSVRAGDRVAGSPRLVRVRTANGNDYDA